MRLYNCSAECSICDLVSYNTRLFWVDYPYYILYLYPSNTSKMHIFYKIKNFYRLSCHEKSRALIFQILYKRPIENIWRT